MCKVQVCTNVLCMSVPLPTVRVLGFSMLLDIEINLVDNSGTTSTFPFFLLPLGAPPTISKIESDDVNYN